jgi:hypothetical protein
VPPQAQGCVRRRGRERMGKVTPFPVRTARVAATRILRSRPIRTSVCISRYTHPAFPRHSHLHVQHTMPESLLDKRRFLTFLPERFDTMRR